MKYFEVRDRAAFIPVVAFQPAALDQVTLDAATRKVIQYGLGRTGWDAENPGVLVIRLDTGRTAPYDTRGRTMHAAHDYIQNNWNALASGAVIDVECVLGEKSLKEHKTSEALG